MKNIIKERSNNKETTKIKAAVKKEPIKNKTIKYFLNKIRYVYNNNQKKGVIPNCLTNEACKHLINIATNLKCTSDFIV